jgi:hypothetical protein
MRLCCVPLMRDRSGDFCGMGLVVYELAGKLSRAFSSSALAACMMSADVLGRVVRFGEPGFNGSGGGARSGSELSHLCRQVSRMSWAQVRVYTWDGVRQKTYIGMFDQECECLTSSRSRESSRSVEGMV